MYWLMKNCKDYKDWYVKTVLLSIIPSGNVGFNSFTLTDKVFRFKVFLCLLPYPLNLNINIVSFMWKVQYQRSSNFYYVALICLKFFGIATDIINKTVFKIPLLSFLWGCLYWYCIIVVKGLHSKYKIEWRKNQVPFWKGEQLSTADNIMDMLFFDWSS